MKVRNRKTGLVKELGALALIAAILCGRVRVGKAPGLRRQAIVGGKHPPRNAPCHCGKMNDGKPIKFKHCHGATQEQKDRRLAAAAYHEDGCDYRPYS